MQLSGSEALTVQVDNESGYIIKCSGPNGDNETAGQLVEASGDSTSIVKYAVPLASTNQTAYIVDPSIVKGGLICNVDQSEQSTQNVDKDRVFDFKTTESSLADTVESKVDDDDDDDNSKRSQVEIAIQANDYDIERRSGKVPARKRMIPFKFRLLHDTITFIH